MEELLGDGLRGKANSNTYFTPRKTTAGLGLIRKAE